MVLKYIKEYKLKKFRSMNLRIQGSKPNLNNNFYSSTNLLELLAVFNLCYTQNFIHQNLNLTKNMAILINNVAFKANIHKEMSLHSLIFSVDS